jgi:hypothetical protein
MMLAAAKALAAGKEPEAPRRAGAYALRAGGCVAEAGMPFDEVMKQRFGDAVGRVR